MKSKLGIDFDKVGHAREMARKIADQVQDFVDLGVETKLVLLF